MPPSTASVVPEHARRGLAAACSSGGHAPRHRPRCTKRKSTSASARSGTVFFPCPPRDLPDVHRDAARVVGERLRPVDEPRRAPRSRWRLSACVVARVRGLALGDHRQRRPCPCARDDGVVGAAGLEHQRRRRAAKLALQYEPGPRASRPPRRDTMTKRTGTRRADPVARARAAPRSRRPGRPSCRARRARARCRPRRKPSKAPGGNTVSRWPTMASTPSAALRRGATNTPRGAARSARSERAHRHAGESTRALARASPPPRLRPRGLSVKEFTTTRRSMSAEHRVFALAKVERTRSCMARALHDTGIGRPSTRSRCRW